MSRAVAVAALVAFSAIGGIVFSTWCDILRLNILDIEQAHRIGYAGEIAESMKPVHPRNLSSTTEVALATTDMVGTLVSFAWMVVQRRERGDYLAGLLPLAVVCLSMVPGFLWVSPVWVEPQPAEWNALQRIVLASDLWLPVALVLLGLIWLGLWHLAKDMPDPQPGDDVPPGHEGA